ncbi:MAG: HIT family protein [Alphaproteobacteria bacterium]|nr:HIT family protein [Alphaproteobacteria bacterium]
MSASCLFCKIARREIPSHVVHDDEDSFAFMDIRPIRPGHTLVIPKAHVDHFSDLPDAASTKVLMVAQRLARKIRVTLAPPRVGFLVGGFAVPHAHLHVVPMEDGHDLTSQMYAKVTDGTVAYDIANIPPAAPAGLAEMAVRIKNQA